MKTLKVLRRTPYINDAAFSVRGVGVLELMPPCIIDRPSGTGDYLFMFFYDAGVLETRSRRIEHGPDVFIIWEPQDSHYYGNPRRRWNHSWIHFSGAFAAGAIAESGLPFGQPVEFDSPSVIETALAEIFGECVDPRGPDAVVARNAFHSLLRKMARRLRDGAENRVPEKFLELKRHLEINFEKEWTLEEMAGEVHISQPHFCAEWKRLFGTPPMQYVIELRMHHAAYLLRDINLNVGEIARRVGYDDIYYFSRIFKKHHGFSPRNLRKNLERG